MSFFDEVETTVANTRFIQASSQKRVVQMTFKDFETLSVLDQ